MHAKDAVVARTRVEDDMRHVRGHGLHIPVE